MRRPEAQRAPALRSLVPITVGHVASVAVVCAALVSGLSMDRRLMLALAGGLLVVAAVVCLAGRTPQVTRALAGQAGWGIGSFVVSTAHGAGLALVPALMPLCLGEAAAGGAMVSGALWQAIGAVVAHGVVMIAVTGAIATGMRACRNRVRWIVVHRWPGMFPAGRDLFRRTSP
ncbi:hypothetical protein [Hydrogenophaga sp.]|uniref:hypothetical protein n=1 Tax=Hydrogenophaga sp. TaxID=1904254 RepID=UPI002FC838EC